jgi:hypothetical protein
MSEKDKRGRREKRKGRGIYKNRRILVDPVLDSLRAATYKVNH